MLQGHDHDASSLSNCKIVVTGATGFLGSHLTSRLCATGALVHAISRKRQQSQTKDMRWWQGDMADMAAVREIFRAVQPDIVFHLSGMATASPERDFVLPTLHSLLVSTVNVLAEAAESGSYRVVLAASLTEPPSGSADVTPGSPYAAAKWASGAYARMFHSIYRVPVVMVRPYMTYGPGQSERKLIPYVIDSLLRGEAPRLSSGAQQIDWVYIDDVIDGFVAAAGAPNIEGQTIDLGSGELVTIRSVVTQVMELTGARVKLLFHALPDRPNERVRVANIAEAYAKLGWKPRTALSDGLARTVDWYRKKLKESSLSSAATL